MFRFKPAAGLFALIAVAVSITAASAVYAEEALPAATPQPATIALTKTSETTITGEKAREVKKHHSFPFTFVRAKSTRNRVLTSDRDPNEPEDDMGQARLRSSVVWRR